MSLRLTQLRHASALILVFILLSIPLIPDVAIASSPNEIIFEKYEKLEGADPIRRNNCIAQTFTAISTHTVSAVSVELHYSVKPDTPRWITVSIRNVDENGQIQGTDLTSKSLNGSVVKLSPRWYKFDFNNPIIVNKGNKYAIVVGYSATSHDCYVCGDTSDGYPDGQSFTCSSGCSTCTSWVEYNCDLVFRVHGEEIPVGGEVMPVNKIGLIAPWIALAMVIAAGGIYLVRRRVHS